MATSSSVKNLAGSHSSSLLDVSKFLTDTLKSIQSENLRLADRLKSSENLRGFYFSEVKTLRSGFSTIYSYLKELQRDKSLCVELQIKTKFVMGFVKSCFKDSKKNDVSVQQEQSQMASTIPWSMKNHPQRHHEDFDQSMDTLQRSCARDQHRHLGILDSNNTSQWESNSFLVENKSNLSESLNLRNQLGVSQIIGFGDFDQESLLDHTGMQKITQQIPQANIKVSKVPNQAKVPKLDLGNLAKCQNDDSIDSDSSSEKNLDSKAKKIKKIRRNLSRIKLALSAHLEKKQDGQDQQTLNKIKLHQSILETLKDDIFSKKGFLSKFGQEMHEESGESKNLSQEDIDQINREIKRVNDTNKIFQDGQTEAEVKVESNKSRFAKRIFSFFANAFNADIEDFSMDPNNL